MEFPLRGADGVFRWFLTLVNPVRDDSGRVLRWFGTNTDVDQVKQAREALRDETRILELLNQTGTALAADKQGTRAASTDVQPKQLRQLASDRHLTTLEPLAMPDRDDTLGKADILDSELHQLGCPHSGLEQRLKHQTRASVLGVGMIEKAKLFFDREAIHAIASLGRRAQSGARSPARARAALKTALLCE